LLFLAQGGDLAALEKLFRRYQRYLRSLAAIQVGRRLQGKADPSDLVQETCLEAHRHFKLFRGQTPAEFVAWLRSILAGLIANHIRRHLGTKRRDIRLERGLTLELEASALLDRELPDGGSSPSERVIRKESTQSLTEALGRLPADYREVIVMRNYENLSFPAIAARMQRTVDSVQKLWIRALAQLRQAIKDERRDL